MTKKLSEEVKLMRTRVVLKEDSVKFPNSSDFPRSVPGVDDSWNFDKFTENFRVDIVKIDKLNLEFDLVGIDAAIANAFRRICLVEIPTMAIEKVWIWNNNSIMADEGLAHRLGLVPIDADPDIFEYFDEDAPEDQQFTDANTIIFDLKVKMNPLTSKEKKEKEKSLVETMDVTTADIKWRPVMNQATDWAERPPRPLDDDIVLLKLAPNQEIDIEMFCTKGIGKTHAKWQPGTTSYRLLPDIYFLGPVEGENAKNMQKCFSKGVIEVTKNDKGVDVAKVKSSRMDTMSREVFRHPELAELVEITRIRDHFIFSIESLGALPPQTIFSKSIDVLSEKCDSILAALDNMNQK